MYFDMIEEGRWYFKMGRTTGITCGICHGIRLDVQRAGQIRWDSDGSQVDHDSVTTRELIIMSEDSISNGVAASFSMPGDSVSFVFDARGQIAGLMYGNFSGLVGPADNMRQHINSGLVTSMDEIIRSIESKTGGKLDLPASS